jgi:hypothetical protein
MVRYQCTAPGSGPNWRGSSRSLVPRACLDPQLFRLGTIEMATAPPMVKAGARIRNPGYPADIGGRRRRKILT